MRNSEKKAEFYVSEGYECRDLQGKRVHMLSEFQNRGASAISKLAYAAGIAAAALAGAGVMYMIR